jgi:two-component sensor histidine kinase
LAHPAKVTFTESSDSPPQATEEIEAIVSRELDHRIGNSLQLATDFLLFEQLRATDPVARAALTEVATRLCAVGQMHRFLSAHGETAAVACKPFLEHLAGFISAATGLKCTVDTDSLTLTGETAQQIALVINELAINTAKHAYPNGAPGAFHITARKKRKTLHLTISDEGRGLAQGGGGSSTGLGMSIVQAILRQLHSSLQATDDHGAVFQFSVPLPSKDVRSSAHKAPNAPEPNTL